MRTLFRNARYCRLFSAHVVALIGTGLTTVALGLLAYDLAGERATVVLGAALAIKMAAYVAVAPVVGAVADRVPRRLIMLIANLVRGATVAVLPWVTEVWQVFTLIAILQAASATFTPILQSVLPDILPDEDDYARALSATQVAVSLETLLSPLLAAAALAIVSYSSLFGATAVGFGMSALLVATTMVPPVARRAGGGFTSRLGLGVRLFRATPQLRGLLALNLVVAATGAISLVTTVNVVRDLLGGDEAQVGPAPGGGGGRNCRRGADGPMAGATHRRPKSDAHRRGAVGARNHRGHRARRSTVVADGYRRLVPDRFRSGLDHRPDRSRTARRGRRSAAPGTVQRAVLPVPRLLAAHLPADRLAGRRHRVRLHLGRPRRDRRRRGRQRCSHLADPGRGPDPASTRTRHRRASPRRGTLGRPRVDPFTPSRPRRFPSARPGARLNSRAGPRPGWNRPGVGAWRGPMWGA